MGLEIEDWVGIIVAILMFIFVGAMIGEAHYGKQIILSHNTADKICSDLTNQSGTIAMDYHDFKMDNPPIKEGELYCKTPSYDSTQLIKVGN